jgi:hypothetical protein
LKLCTLETKKKSIFRGRKLTLGHFVKGIIATKLDSVRQCIYTVLIRVTGDGKRKLVACSVAVL